MGLTIHWNFQHTSNLTTARQVIQQLRQRALDLPFEDVGDVIELKDDECQYEPGNHDDPLLWYKIQAGEYVDTDDGSVQVTPRGVIGFEITVGDECEPMNVILAQYPLIIEQMGKEIRTNLDGWRGRGFCKTQYASSVSIEHFLRCHLSVIKMLDAADELGILAQVNDEGEYWGKRDVKALAKKVGEWNCLLAGVVGVLKDQAEETGHSIEAAILGNPAFEHLEAKGRDVTG